MFTIPKSFTIPKTLLKVYSYILILLKSFILYLLWKKLGKMKVVGMFQNSSLFERLKWKEKNQISSNGSTGIVGDVVGVTYN